MPPPHEPVAGAAVSSRTGCLLVLLQFWWLVTDTILQSDVRGPKWLITEKTNRSPARSCCGGRARVWARAAAPSNRQKTSLSSPIRHRWQGQTDRPHLRSLLTSKNPLGSRRRRPPLLSKRQHQQWESLRTLRPGHRLLSAATNRRRVRHQNRRRAAAALFLGNYGLS